MTNEKLVEGVLSSLGRIFRHATSSPATIGTITLSDAVELHRAWNAGNKDGKRINFRGRNLKEANLEGAFLENAVMELCYLDKVDFSGAFLDGADFYRSTITRANLRNAKLIGTDFEKCDCEYSDFSETFMGNTNFESAVLDNCRFEDIKISGKIYINNKTSFNGSRVNGAFRQFLVSAGWDVVNNVVVGKVAKY